MSFVNMEVIGEEEMRRKFAVLGARGPEQLGLPRVMVSEAEGTMRDSRRFVPVVTGALRASGTVDPPQIIGDQVIVTFGYGGASVRYARKVHENPRAGRTGGVSPSGKKYYPRPGLPVPYSTVGQWKYLEQPFLARRTRILEAIATEIHRRIEGGGR